jgi:hypothetical protein
VNAALLWSACILIAGLVAADFLRDRARQRREDREWAEIRQMLEAERW